MTSYRNISMYKGYQNAKSSEVGHITELLERGNCFHRVLAVLRSLQMSKHGASEKTPRTCSCENEASAPRIAFRLGRDL